jgi:hypothetical protein
MVNRKIFSFRNQIQQGEIGASFLLGFLFRRFEVLRTLESQMERTNFLSSDEGGHRNVKR